MTSSDDYTAFAEPWRNPDIANDPARRAWAEGEETMAIVEGDAGTEARPVFPLNRDSIRFVDEKLTERATRFIAAQAKAKGGSMTIAVGPATRVKPLPALIRRASTAFPGLRIETRQVEGPAVARSVAEGLYDIAIGNRENAEPYGDLIRVKLFEDRVAATVRAGHPLATRTRIEARALLGYPVASFRIGQTFRSLIGPIDAAEEDRLRAFQTDDSGLLRDYVLESNAIGWAPRFVFADKVASGAAAELPLSGDAPFECWFLTTPGHWTSPVVQAIAGFAHEAGAAP